MTLTRADFEAVASPLSGAGESGRERLLEASLVPAVKLAIREFLAERAAVLVEDHRSLGDALERLAADPLTADEALSLPVTHLRLGMRDGSGVDPLWAAASMAAQASALGRPAPWQASFDAPRRLRFCGTYGPAAVRVDVEPGPGVLDVSFEGAERDRCRLSLSEIAVAAEEGVPGVGWERLLAVRVARAGLVIHPPATPDLLWVAPDTDFSASPLAAIAETITHAVDTLRTYAPEYLPWVDRVVRTIVPIRCPPDTSISRSVKGEHGIVYASFPSDVLHMAEVLVHEAAHQYFNILEHGVWLASPLEDARLYYSPYVRTERTIDRILFAYHAFANVLLFHRRCLAGGLDPRHSPGNELAGQERLLGILDEHLRRTTGLRPAGRALYTTLAERVARTSEVSWP